MSECTFIIFGATGDLARRKLIPALYQLIATKKIEKFLIVGAASTAATPEIILDRAREFISEPDPKLWQKLVNATHYQKLDFTKKEGFVALNKLVASLEKSKRMAGNRICYLAAAANFFCNITEHLASSGIVKRASTLKKKWQRIVYEKPFGYDLESAHAINECIAEHFDEKQIYRIDHYLAKELVGNIALVRFTNIVFEPLWNNRFIDLVQIVLSEQICLEGRGRYYDKYGAIKDVVQNHMLEILSLIAMESPVRLTGEYIRDERIKVLEDLEFVDGILGQYKGYLQEDDVASDSTMETFAALGFRVNNPRWAGVPFYLKTGKCLDKKETVIHIKFKQVDCLLARNCPSDSNWLTIRITPDAGFYLSLNAKKPGYAEEVIPVKMDFCHSCLFGPKTPTAYEILLEEVVRGETSVSVRFDEIEHAWRIIDQVVEKKLPVYPYEKKTAGPKEMEEFAKKHGFRWRS